jgi:ketosteroid isomerase-like protein
MRSQPYAKIALLMLLAAGSALRAEDASGELAAQVEAVERAFAQTMADRDFQGFQVFLADEAVFLGGDAVRRGKREVVEQWRRYFEGAEAPVSWRPETVEVLDSGRLAISTGPVFDAAGQRTATYTSIWRRGDSGEWRIVFDRGNSYCE